MFHDIYETARRYNEPNNLLCGENILSFKKIAKAMHEQGVT
jgi:glutamate dehydrogenase/leucine dehydrogenase